MSKLIILRGPSGAGKSTVADMLHRRAVKKTALVEQDHFRHKLLNNPHQDLEIARHIMVASIREALDRDCDVILEGILSMGKYQSYFDDLFAHHPTDNYLFYFDVSFEETARRHATRAKNQQLSAEEMREWYGRAGPSGYPGEQTIPEDLTPEAATQYIADVADINVR